MEVLKLNRRIETVMNENSGAESKRRKLFQITLDVAAAIAPHAVCRAGCSHCCKTSALIYQSEADKIGKYLGRAPVQIAARTPEEAESQLRPMRETYYGKPCPLLVNNRCSVYEVRPYVCRQQHSLDETPDQCDTDKVRSEDSSVPHYNLKHLEFAVLYVAMSSGDQMGDIREFFPE
jgi:Fe-S-cluster containining protein